jgi:L-fuconolactonase
MLRNPGTLCKTFWSAAPRPSAKRMAPFTYTDAHVHFWDPSLRPYRWLAECPSIAGPHGPADLTREAAGEAPSRVVFVQADCEPGAALGEADWVASLADLLPPTAGIVAFAPMNAGSATLAALGSLAARPRVRGVRHLIQGEADPAFCLSAAFVAGVRACGAHGLSFDLCVRHHQIAAATKLAALCPDTSFILDHAGKPDLRSGKLEAWRTDIAALASLAHVACKVSGLLTEADPADLAIERFVPVVRYLLDTFGPERLLFGSDWPVVKLAAPYPAWLKMAKMLLAHLPEPEQAGIFDANAARLYRLA